MSEKPIEDYFSVSKRKVKYDLRKRSGKTTSKPKEIAKEISVPVTKLATPPSSPHRCPIKTPFSPLKSTTPSKSPIIASRGSVAVHLALEKMGKVSESRSLPSTPTSITSSPKLAKFDVLEFNSPQKKSRKRLDYGVPKPSDTVPLSSSLSGSTPANLPAYQRLQPLITDTPTSLLSSDVPLPHLYQLLIDKFSCVDTVTTMLQKRKEICTFEKLKESVQSMSKRNFELKHLGQIRHVYPEAYIIRMEKLSTRSKLPRYELTVQCSAHEGDKGEKGVASELPYGKGILNPSIMVKRKTRFRENIVNIVAGFHKEFLLSLDPPVEIPMDKVYRWHPKFLLDDVPDIPEADLPKPPTDYTESCSNPKHVFSEEKKKVSKNLEVAFEEAKQELKMGQDAKTSENKLLKGVSSDLLERVRLKEVANAKVAMMRNPEKERELVMLSRLPEMCRIIKTLFVSEKKAALLVEHVTNKIKDSHKSGLDTDQIEEHLDLLLKTMPEWLKKVTVRGSVYLKINKDTDFNCSLKRLEKKREELKQSL